ncbi:hypothetical protein A3A67_04670 [Candidatus Peribacteria bacterium RIFCSPLOWO2_01_FULL_51_18]|nr:MAG: hypothetical protein A3C52_01885 [Candidatus Peribacteria bacterium RIFCSPHIGHO2_02_FULL_51_15]OGJ66700.1 MAG: hypothetical protein A3A67_04670 [Candidatus Peribacteria bacterium RIFCSPLOWO2_01_FULL_51_18]OGJ68365.1 MAG: hypothetical protein A3J34_04810 [Candidatus Peribacteria bacterium RIFCSPLOWO2_02_FULL_51_10]
MEYTSGLAWVADKNTPEKTYVTRVLNLGTWEEWQALKQSASRDQIMDAVEHPLKGQWTKKGKSFVECVFHRILPDEALISYA